MPLYEYNCADCGVTFEMLRPMSKGDAPAACTKCGSTDTARAISLFAAVSKSRNGGSQTIRGTGGGCGSCAGGNCGSCNH